MKRLIEETIVEHLKKDNCLPLLILGARQIGKTYIINKIANNHFSDNYLYLNFLDKNVLYKKLNGLTSPTEIIDVIEFYTKKKINKNTLLIFDEIQEIPSLKSSIKNFVESEKCYKIICMGSYLGNTLLNDNLPFPVGKIKIIDMYQMNFHEYLLATNNQELVEIIKEAIKTKKAINKKYHDKLLSLLYEFIIIGGMPAVVKSFLNNQDFDEVYDLKKDLYNQYRNDLLKYIDKKVNKTKSLLIYDNIPIFLSRVNKKYKLSNVESSMKYLNSQVAIKNLLMTKIIYKINNIKTFNSPLNTRQIENEFKIYYNDPGFVSLNFNLNQTILFNNQNIYTNEKGALIENYFVSEILMKTSNLFYYAFRGDENISKQNNSNTAYEIDFCLENNEGRVIPIEIKLGSTYSKKSINKIMKQNKPPYGIVFSSKNFNYDKEKNIFYIPLYAISFLEIKQGRLNW